MKKNSKTHIYRILDKVLVRNKKENKHGDTYVSSFMINKIWNNGNVTISWDAVQERIEIIWIKTCDK